MKQNELRQFIHKIYYLAGKIHLIRNIEIPLEIGIHANSATLYALNMINLNPDLKMSELSRKIGITKGAFSQMAKKLEQKELITRSKSMENSKDIYLIVTDQGKQAAEEYIRLHDKLYQGIDTILNQYNETEQQTITEFLNKTNQFLEVYTNLKA
ncbi:MAG: MarR family transcriptional regulator [Clostridiales bacterium]|nr:MarR family transcriptional regulator [Clostridiales bacterium]